MTVNWNLNKIYRKNGEIDGRCQQARHWREIDIHIDEDETVYRDQILEHWNSLTETERAFERLSNSHTWRISEYAINTAPEDSNYYYNSQGVLTAPPVDPTMPDRVAKIFNILK